jgi:carboxyl-terminal processing protease
MTASPPPQPSTPAPASRAPLLPWVVSLALAAVVGAVLFLGGYLAGGGGGATGCAAPDEAFAAFCEAYDRLQAEYVDQLDPDELAEGAIRGMLEYGIGDPNTSYMPPQQYDQALGSLSGQFGGIGAEMTVRNAENPNDLGACESFSDTCLLVVVAPIPETPAHRAGIQPDDVVLAVDGDPVDGSTMTAQIERIRGEPGTDVTLTIRRGDDEPFDVTITRAEIEIQEVRTRMLEGDVGYIALNNFSARASEQFAAGLTDLLERGADRIVFDLRDNPGGYIEAAQEVASQFIGSGLVFTQESAGNDVKRYEATGDGVATDPDLPVAVLVNGFSASASEIVAAALQESGRATIVGEPTYGKNTVQVWSRLQNDAGIRITISRWFTPEHNSVAPDGVQPDIAAARTEDTPADSDPVLDAALDHLAEEPVADDADATRPVPDVATTFRLPATVGVVALRAIC